MGKTNVTITDRPIQKRDDSGADFDPGSGAVITFAGVVRNQNDDRPVTGIYYECYREMAERELRRVVDEGVDGQEVDISVVHRIGEVAVGEISLLVVVASPHRQAAFDVCQQVIDTIKERVPIWKKEHYADESTRWL